MVLGAKRLGYGGQTTRVENRGETTRGKRLGGNVLGAKRLVTVQNAFTGDIWWSAHAPVNGGPVFPGTILGHFRI